MSPSDLLLLDCVQAGQERYIEGRPEPRGIWPSAATNAGERMSSAAQGDPSPGMLGTQGGTIVENISLLTRDKQHVSGVLCARRPCSPLSPQPLCKGNAGIPFGALPSIAGSYLSGEINDSVWTGTLEELPASRGPPDVELCAVPRASSRAG